MYGLLDYIVYMTYDLHGQWDWGKHFTQDSCDNGDCLRSHVNWTETTWSLAMSTKAGVPANKLTVGVASYGRSFGMMDSSCTGLTCHYTGPDSTAVSGFCTNTPGYISNAEIQFSIAWDGLTPQYDASSNSMILVNAGNNWVSYMDHNIMAFRKLCYQIWGFAGSAEWAIDLSSFTPDGGMGNGLGTNVNNGVSTTGSGGGFSQKRSGSMPFTPRDQRQACQPFQLSLFQSQSSRVYEYCANNDILAY
ncbi:hypothetical protein AMS68_002865 [Peltaster fructicola]|uniref:GH18 domain-containing protein n=1 Tax=Peltaster fructicola TaxID=286661 RepID=A0A6H0XRU2_9PEZI|nr:hypothetical protein AMS68_002865 [Peltaster fructicola]